MKGMAGARPFELPHEIPVRLFQVPDDFYWSKQIPGFPLMISTNMLIIAGKNYPLGGLGESKFNVNIQNTHAAAKEVTRQYNSSLEIIANPYRKMNTSNLNNSGRSWPAIGGKLMASLGVICALFIGTVAARAQLLDYEPFNYPLGALTSGTAGTGTGETGNWTCGQSGTIVSGLIYTGLPVSNNALSSGIGRQYISFATPITPVASGTNWYSFLYTASGNMGGNYDGLYFLNGGTGLFFGFGMAPNSGTQGGFGLASMSTTGTIVAGGANIASSFLGTYGVTYMVAIEVIYPASGSTDTIKVYLNPVAGAKNPGVSSTYSVSSSVVGTVTGVGLNVQGGANITVDEIRGGVSYADVSGYVAPPSAPAGRTASLVNNLITLNWNAVSGATGYYILRGT